MATIPTTRRDRSSNESAPRECGAEGCDKEARCAIWTRRPNRGTLYSAVYFDDRTAPRSATPYCKEHGTEIMDSTMSLLVDGDA